MGELITLVLGLAGLALLFWLFSQRWVWMVVIAIAGLACAFTTLASIIHFQIFGALVFAFLTVLCWLAVAALGEF